MKFVWEVEFLHFFSVDKALCNLENTDEGYKFFCIKSSSDQLML
jgi:hypothetical protein